MSVEHEPGAGHHSGAGDGAASRHGWKPVLAETPASEGDRISQQTHKTGTYHVGGSAEQENEVQTKERGGGSRRPLVRRTAVRTLARSHADLEVTSLSFPETELQGLRAGAGAGGRTRAGGGSWRGAAMTKLPTLLAITPAK